MTDLLTTRQLLELLQVDRITIYRMLNAGRLKGVKVGGQWRFSQGEVERLLGASARTATIEVGETPENFPAASVQGVLGLFAGLLGVSAMAVSVAGSRLAPISQPSAFCQMMLSSPGGQTACRQSWQQITTPTARLGPFQVCHAGLAYLRSNILAGEKTVAWMIVGQFLLPPLAGACDRTWIERMAQLYQLPAEDLMNAAHSIPTLSRRQQAAVQEWAPRAAQALSAIVAERAELLDRLHRIAQISSFTAPRSGEAE